MLANKITLALILAGLAGGASAAALTVGEATQMQSEITRAELNVRLEETKKKLGSAMPAPPAVVAEAKEADELLSLISVYGVGKNLKADFLFRGAIVTLAVGGAVGAVGWTLESLTPTQAVLVKKDGKVVTRRSTLYLTGMRTDKVYASGHEGEASAAGARARSAGDTAVAESSVGQPVMAPASTQTAPGPVVNAPPTGMAPVQAPAPAMAGR